MEYQQTEKQFQLEDKRAKPLSLSTIHSEEQEEHYLDIVHKEEFFNLANDYRINIKTLFTKILTLREKHRFNIFLRNIKEKNGIRIMDSLMYIEEGYARFNQMIKTLDQENTHLMKTEASEIGTKYKMPTNWLNDFLEFEQK